MVNDSINHTFALEWGSALIKIAFFCAHVWQLALPHYWRTKPLPGVSNG